MNMEGFADQMNYSGRGSGCAHLLTQTPLFCVVHQQEEDANLQPEEGDSGEEEELDHKKPGRGPSVRKVQDKVCMQCDCSEHNCSLLPSITPVACWVCRIEEQY